MSFASNDYLGLTQHPAVVAAAHDALDRWGAGSGSARLIVGSRPMHGELERALAEWKGTERAVLFPTGFAANLGVLTTFGGPGVLVCSDELNHASIIDGCRLSRAEVAVYRHADLEHLDWLLARRDGRRALVVSDTVFSMDGDLADLDGLVRVAHRHDALLVLDEAHAVLGPRGRRRSPTASTSCGSARCRRPWARSAGSSRRSDALADLVVNRARSYIFTTAATPADTAAALAALRVLTGPEGAALVERLRTPRRAGAARSRLADRARSVRRRSSARSTRRPRCSNAGCSSPRSARRPFPPAPPVCASRSRPRTRPHRSSGSSPRSPRSVVIGAAGVIVVVTGTGTDVGKTWFTAATIDALRASGHTVAACKPVQSFAPGDEGTTDADVLARATGDAPDVVCPPHRWLPMPVAPPMAAAALGLPPFTIADLAGEVRARARRRPTPTSCSSKAPAACARRSPTTATPSRSRTRSPPTGS